MKNFELVTLVENGILNITVHNLSTAHAYKIVKFKSMMRKAYDDYNESLNALVKEAGIEDGRAFDQEMAKLREKKDLNKTEKKQLADMTAQLSKLGEMRKKLAEEEIKPEGVKTMPYEEWKKLQDENKEIKIGQFELLAFAEGPLENILWRAPEEDEGPVDAE